MTDMELIERAKDAILKAYAPYSGFRVGASVETINGSVYTGSNIENLSYGATVCAERTAILKAVSEGHRKIKKIAVVSDGGAITYPCGICRQVINEFSTGETRIICADMKGNYEVFTLNELYPHAFKDIFRKSRR